MTPAWTIEQKRDGHELSEGAIRDFVKGIATGAIPDAQVAAFAMAIYFQGMTPQETAVLTDAMMYSGRCLDLSKAPRPTVDKHSTGGVGDKISIPLAPLCASCGLAVPMIAGRALGITGGTIDKLEAISGFRTNLSLNEFERYVTNEPFCAITGQTTELAPADGRLYAIRDITATVHSIPLITASILSKKLAEGAEAIVFDVHYGRGAFMHTLEDAEKLSASLRTIAERLGRKVDVKLSLMDVPHGRTVGNACEIEESIEILKGGGPADVREHTLDLARRMLRLAGDTTTDPAENLSNGKAYDYFLKMCRTQGAELPIRLPKANYQIPLLAEASGTIQDVDAASIARGVQLLGAGRSTPGEKIDLSVGIRGMLRPGEEVTRGEPLLYVSSSSEGHYLSAKPILRSAFTIGEP